MPSLRDRATALARRVLGEGDTPPILTTEELAIADTRRWSWIGNSASTWPYNPDELALGKGGLRIYDEMRRDDQVKVSLWITKAAILGPGWQIEPTSDADADIEFAKEIQTALDDADFDQTLWDLLTALDYGFAVGEIIYENGDGGIALKAVKGRAPHAIDFKQDPHGNVESIQQMQGGATIEMPPSKFMHFAPNTEFSNPYGRSMLFEAHKYWFFKLQWLQWWAMFGEKLAIPPVIGKHKATENANAARVLQLLSKLQAGTALTVGEGWTDITTLETQRDPRAVFESAINRLDLGIARSILVPEKLGVAGGETKQGSMALSQTHFDVWLLVMDLFRRRMERCANRHLIRDMAAMMDAGREVPLLKLMPLRQDDKSALGRLWIDAVTNGVALSTIKDENQFRNMIGFDAREEDATIDAEPRGGTTVQPGGMPPPPSPEEIALNKAKAAALGAKPDPTKPDQAKMAEGDYWRPLTLAEQRANIGEKAHALDTLAQGMGQTMAAAVGELVVDLERRAAKAPRTAQAARNLAAGAGKEAAVKRAVEAALKDAYVVGQQTAAREVASLPTGMATFSDTQRDFVELAQRGGLMGSRAMQFFTQKALWITGNLVTDVIKRAQVVLFNALKQDKTPAQVQYELHQAVGDYLPETDAAGRVVNVPARIETIARTNIGEAYEEGRWATFTDPDLEGFITELQYSAVMDSRTRENHRAWDGVTLPPDHPAWHTPTDNRPKNGFNCRCTLVPLSAADDTPQTPDAQIPRVPAADPGFK